MRLGTLLLLLLPSLVSAQDTSHEPIYYGVGSYLEKKIVCHWTIEKVEVVKSKDTAPIPKGLKSYVRDNVLVIYGQITDGSYTESKFTIHCYDSRTGKRHQITYTLIRIGG